MSTNQFCYAITVGNKTKIGLSKNPKARMSGILTQAGIHQDDAEVSFFEVEDMQAFAKDKSKQFQDKLLVEKKRLQKLELSKQI